MIYCTLGDECSAHILSAYILEQPNTHKSVGGIRRPGPRRRSQLRILYTTSNSCERKRQRDAIKNFADGYCTICVDTSCTCLSGSFTLSQRLLAQDSPSVLPRFAFDNQILRHSLRDSEMRMDKDHEEVNEGKDKQGENGDHAKVTMSSPFSHSWRLVNGR